MSQSQDNRTVMEKIKDDFLPSLVSGGVGILGAKYLLGVDINMTLNVMNMNVPAWAAIGGVIAASDIAGYVLHDAILEKIPYLQSSGIATYENRLATPMIAGVSTYALFLTTVSKDVSLLNSILLGAGATVSGQYLYHTYEMNKN